MSIYIGEDKIEDFYIGEDHISKIYAGEDLVWSGMAEMIGTPPLAFKATGNSLTDYRIYGNTVNSQGCGVYTGADLLDLGTLRAGDYNGTSTSIRVSQNVSDRYVIQAAGDFTIKASAANIQALGKPFLVWAVVTDNNNTLQKLIVTAYELTANQPSVTFSCTSEDVGNQLTLIFGSQNAGSSTWNTITVAEVRLCHPELYAIPDPAAYECPVVIGGKNLTYRTIAGTNVAENGRIASDARFNTHIAKVRAHKRYFFNREDENVYAFYALEPSGGSQSYNGSRSVETTSYFDAPIDGYVAFRSNAGDPEDLTMLAESETLLSEYEPYVAPVTVRVPLGDSQLMAGEYVSYAEQKIYKMIDGVLTPTNPPSSLPLIPLLSGTNMLRIDTDVQPVSVHIKGKIDPITI